MFIAVKQRVMTRMNEWQKLYETGDIEALTQMYTEMCKVFPWNDFKHEGREGMSPSIYFSYNPTTLCSLFLQTLFCNIRKLRILYILQVSAKSTKMNATLESPRPPSWSWRPNKSVTPSPPGCTTVTTRELKCSTKERKCNRHK